MKLTMKQFAKLAVQATHKAYERALDSGSSVMIADKGKLYWVRPDRTREYIKDIDPPVKMKKGQIIQIP